MKCGTSHITGRVAALGQRRRRPRPGSGACRRSGDAYQSRPRSSEAATEPAEVRAREPLALVRCQLGKAQLEVAQRDLATRGDGCQPRRPRALPHTAWSGSGSQWNSQSAASSRRAPNHRLAPATAGRTLRAGCAQGEYRFPAAVPCCATRRAGEEAASGRAARLRGPRRSSRSTSDLRDLLDRGRPGERGDAVEEDARDRAGRHRR